MITLTNGVQIPENAVQLQTTAAIDGLYVTQPLRLVQYDETLPVAAVQLTYQNQPYIPPTGAELNVRMGKPDGKGVYNPCLGVDSNGVAYFAFTLQMTIVAGYGTLTVEVTDSGVKNSAPIIVDIRRNPVPEGAIESADEFLTLQEILAEAEKWGQIVQANASNIQQVVDNLTDIQNAAENAQAAAESAAAAQQAAQEALGFRTFFSAVRPDSNGNLDPSRPMTVGPAASVEIESAGDRIQSVTALGFTQQAGTGDPSPSNVRQLTNGGLRYGVIVYDGSSDESYTINGKSFIISPVPKGITAPSSGGKITDLICNLLPPKSSDSTYLGQQGISQAAETDARVQICVEGITTTTGIKEWLQQNPITVWYPLETGSLYAPIILQGSEYRATCLPLTAPLCEGDSVVSWVKSGCDKVITFDGSEDEGWVADSESGTGPSGSKRMYAKLSFNVPNGDNAVKSVAYFDYLENVTSNSLYVGPQDNVGAVTQSQRLSSGVVYVRIAGISTLSALKEYLAANPLTVWYRSTNYTEADDIAVSLETHVRWAANVFDVTRSWVLREDLTPNLFIGVISPHPKNAVCVCDTYKGVFTDWVRIQDNQIQVLNDGSYIGIKDSRYSVVGDFTQALESTPVTIVYELATPITYAHPAVVLEAATGDQLTYTVTGQSGGTVSVTLKPFQDGGHAKTADNAANAQNATQFDGLSLSELQNLLVPVGFIFSWAPVGDGPDLSTPAKVAEYFGFGTWQAYGKGQVLVGLDAGQTEFATVGKTGGEKAHSLTTAEGPKHAHGLKWEHEGGLGTGNGVLIKDANDGESYPYTYFTEFSGSGQAHNNLQPYITVFRYRRVA